MKYKEIHIGEYIREKVKEENIEIDRLIRFFSVSEKEIENMYAEPDIKTSLLLKWSKILDYDFFRIYSQHLIMYAPPKSNNKEKRKAVQSLPTFRKNVYTQEIVAFVVEMVHSGKKTKLQVMEDYKIPKTTLYKWLKKYEQ